MGCLFTMVAFSITTSKQSLLKGRSSMSASNTFSSDYGNREMKKTINTRRVKYTIFNAIELFQFPFPQVLSVKNHEKLILSP